MNLINIDVGNIAGLATKVWDSTNALISRECIGHAKAWSDSSHGGLLVLVHHVRGQCFHRNRLRASQRTHLNLDLKAHLQYVWAKSHL